MYICEIPAYILVWYNKPWHYIIVIGHNIYLIADTSGAGIRESRKQISTQRLRKVVYGVRKSNWFIDYLCIIQPIDVDKVVFYYVHKFEHKIHSVWNWNQVHLAPCRRQPSDAMSIFVFLLTVGSWASSQLYNFFVLLIYDVFTMKLPKERSTCTYLAFSLGHDS